MGKVDWMENQFDVSHVLGHLVSLGAIFGTVSGIVPAIAALVALIWYALQIWENKSVQTYIRTRRMRKIVKLRAKLVKAQARVVAQELVDNTLDNLSSVTTTVTSTPSPDGVETTSKTTKHLP